MVGLLVFFNVALFALRLCLCFILIFGLVRMFPRRCGFACVYLLILLAFAHSFMISFGRALVIFSFISLRAFNLLAPLYTP